MYCFIIARFSKQQTQRHINFPFARTFLFFSLFLNVQLELIVLLESEKKYFTNFHFTFSGGVSLFDSVCLSLSLSRFLSVCLPLYLPISAFPLSLSVTRAASFCLHVSLTRSHSCALSTPLHRRLCGRTGARRVPQSPHQGAAGALPPSRH